MRRLLVAGTIVAALLVPSGAAAGGWATVGLDSLPDGIEAGDAWSVELTILQHGVTPLDDVEPRVIAERGSERREFAATPTGEPGVYRADVVFPSAGTWSYVVDDGFTMTHTFAPVHVRAPEAGSAPALSGGLFADVRALVQRLLSS
jgi:hypothetical protein